MASFYTVKGILDVKTHFFVVVGVVTNVSGVFILRFQLHSGALWPHLLLSF